MELNSSSGAAIKIYCMNETIESKTNYQLHVLKHMKLRTGGTC